MAYSESLFFLLVALMLLAVQRSSSIWFLALLVGLATACRPVGVGLAPIVAYELYRRSPSRSHFALRSLILLPLSIWGLLAYAGFLYYWVGDPLAFVKVQEAWNRERGMPFTDKIEPLIMLKPIWGCFDSSSKYCFPNFVIIGEYMISSSVPNAVVYLLGVSSIVFGAVKRWLTVAEILTAIGLLTIPYITRGYDSDFLSFARFTAVVLPIYIPLAFILAKRSKLVQILYFALCAWLISLLTALFTAGYHLV